MKSFLDAQYRLKMGLDGGTYVTRSDIIRRSSWAIAQADGSRSTRGGAVSGAQVYKKPRQEGRAAREVQWSSCALSGEPLSPAEAVADYLGALYNRSAVLEFLLARQGAASDEGAAHRYLNQLRAGGGAFEHLTSACDVFTVRLDGAAAAGTRGPPHRCPLSGVDCLAAPFAGLATCGHVCSDRAVKEMQAQAACAVCCVEFTADDVVPMFGSEEAVAGLRERERRRAPARRSQRRKKKRRQAADPAEGPSQSNA